MSDVEMIISDDTVSKVVCNSNVHEVAKLTNQYHWLIAAHKKDWWSAHNIVIPKPLSFHRASSTGTSRLTMERIYMKGKDSTHMDFNTRHMEAIRCCANLFFAEKYNTRQAYLFFCETMILRRANDLNEWLDNYVDVIKLTSMLVYPDTIKMAMQRSGSCHGDFTIDNLGETYSDELVLLDPNFYPTYWQSPLLDYAWFKFNSYVNDIPTSNVFSSAYSQTGAGWFIDLLSIGCAVRAAHYAHRKLKTEFCSRAQRYITTLTRSLTPLFH